MLKDISRLIKDEEAPTAVEYALMVAGIAVLIIVAVFALGDNVKAMFNKASDHIKP